MRTSVRISARGLARWRAATLVVFAAAMALVFGVLWVNMGGQIPLGVTGGYRVTAALSGGQNLVYDSDVRMAGVRVGKIRGLHRGDGVVDATMEIRGSAHPLHEGATVRLRPKTLIEAVLLPHRAALNCARAIRKLRSLFAQPGASPESQWLAIRERLQISRTYMQIITRSSGAWTDETALPEVTRRAWIVMNRLLEYLKRGEALPLSEFPLLT